MNWRGVARGALVPKSLEGIVEGVFGLSDEPFAEPRYCRTRPAQRGGLWAGLLALVNQGLGRNVGFINPAFYQLSPASGAFTDITTGNNGDYQAGPGWDPCTGLGVPNGQRLLTALAQPSLPTPHLEDAPPAEAGPSLPDRSYDEIVSLLRDYFQTTRALIELVKSTRVPSKEKPKK